MSQTSPRAGRHDTGPMGDLHPSGGCLEAKWGRIFQMSVCGQMNRVLGSHQVPSKIFSWPASGYLLQGDLNCSPAFTDLHI